VELKDRLIILPMGFSPCQWDFLRKLLVFVSGQVYKGGLMKVATETKDQMRYFSHQVCNFSFGGCKWKEENSLSFIIFLSW
jgi:hypothetical protein